MATDLHNAARSDFQRSLEGLRDRLTELPADPAALARDFDLIQADFRDRILVLSPEEVAPELAAYWQPFQTELHKVLRAIATDILFLKAARNPATLERRLATLRDRLNGAIGYCQAMEQGKNTSNAPSE